MSLFQNTPDTRKLLHAVVTCQVEKREILHQLFVLSSDTGKETTCYANYLEKGSGDPIELTQTDQQAKDYSSKAQFSFTTTPPPPGEPRETQYLVKWQNLSHLHNTWETEASQ